jgi:mannosyltransferase
MSLRAAFAKVSADWPLLAAVGISLLAAAVRIPSLVESLWIDELHTAWCTLGPLDDVARRAAIGNQAPLYFWVQWFVISGFGPSEYSLRLISVISGSLLPLALLLFARRWSLPTAGLVAGALIAIDHHSVFYATEARPYALLQLLAVIHLAITAEIANRITPRLRVAWIALAAAMFYVHYTSALIIVASAVFLFLARLIQIRRLLAESVSVAQDVRVTDVLIDLAIVGLCCLPQLSNLLYVFGHRANWSTFIDKQPLWNAVAWTPLPAACWVGLVVLVAAAIARVSISDARNGEAADFRILFLAAWSFGLPTAIAWLATSTDFARLFFARYLAGALPAGALSAGVLVAALPFRSVRAATAVATIAVAIWNSDITQQLAHDGQIIVNRGEDWRGCVQWLNERIAEGGFPVLVYSGLIEADELPTQHDPLLDQYCLSPINSLYLLDADPSETFPLTYHNPQLPQAAEQFILHRGGVWLIVRGSTDLAERIASRFRTKLNSPAGADQALQFSTGEIQSFGKVQVCRLANHQP